MVTGNNPKIVIAGAGTYGRFNAGDDAIFRSMVKAFRSEYPDSEISLISANSIDTYTALKVREIPSNDIPGILNEINNCSVFILGGGGIFYDYYGVEKQHLLTQYHAGLPLYAGMTFLASLMNKPIMIFGVGVGPLFTENGRLLTRMVFHCADSITVRDAESKALIKSLGIHKEIEITADPAFLSKGNINLTSPNLPQKERAQNNYPVIGISLREWQLAEESDLWINELREAVDHFVEKNNARLVFIPFHLTTPQVSDKKFIKEFIKRLRNKNRAQILSEKLSTEEKEEEISRCNLIIGMRMHSIIFAIKRSVPFVALEYDPKITNLLKEINYSQYGIPINGLSASEAEAVFESVYSNRLEIAQDLDRIGKQLNSRADKNIDIFHSLLALPSPEPKEQLDIAWIKELALELIQKNDELENRVTSLNIDLSKNYQNFLHDLEAHKRIIDEQKSSIENLTSNNDSLQTQIDQLKFETGLLEEKIGGLNKVIDYKTIENEKKQNEISSLNHIVENQSIDIQTKDAALAEMEKNQNQLSGINSELTSDLVWYREEVDRRSFLHKSNLFSKIFDRAFRGLVFFDRYGLKKLFVKVVEFMQKKPVESGKQRSSNFQQNEIHSANTAEIGESSQTMVSPLYTSNKKKLKSLFARIHIFFRKTWEYLVHLARITRKTNFQNSTKIIKHDIQRKIFPSFRKQRSTLPTMEGLINEFQVLTANHVNLTLSSAQVHILTPTFFDFDGNNMFSGGAERYLIELNTIINQLGYELIIFQCGNSNWIRHYGFLKAIGMDTAGLSYQLLNDHYHKWVSPAKLTIYSPFLLAQPYCREKSIGISHGIFWDSNHVKPDKQKWDEFVFSVMQSLKNTASLVSVDTNTINWTRAQEHELANKWDYIPNFVDLDQFAPSPGGKNHVRTVVLYPRRLYEARGFWMLAKIIPQLLKQCPELEFHFVGKADLPEELEARRLEKTYPGKVKWLVYAPEEMPKAYQAADITLIPTIYSEGTSLSCLEAMASGNAVIATTVGGLTDLIIPDFNGLLVNPVEEDIFNAILRLVNDIGLRSRLGKNAQHTAQAFRKDVWVERWKEELANYLPVVTPAWRPKAQIILPDVGGIEWAGMKQRPHHIAMQFAKTGKDVYWIDPKPERSLSGVENIQILGSQDELYLSRPFMYIYYPYHAARIGEFNNPVVIYDVLDDISIHDASDQLLKIPREYTARYYQQQLFDRADIILTSSEQLYAEVVKVRPDALLIPNGVNLADFDPKKEVVAQALQRVKEKGNPIVGYHGAIADWLDMDLLIHVIQSLPDYEFVFVGPVADPAVASRLVFPNVTSLGLVPYEQMANHIAGFDVEIIPFLVNSITRGVRPLKALESLAMQKPVVSTRLPDVVQWPGIIVADTADEFISSINVAVKTKWNATTLKAVEQFTRRNAWDILVEPLNQRIDEIFKDSHQRHDR